MNIKLFISSFGNDTAWINRHIKNTVTIEVGAACRGLSASEFSEDRVADNTGDNISKDNPYWGELTGLYWIWKNITFNDDDIVGFCHYNKILNISERNIKKFFTENPRGWLVMNRDTCPFSDDDIVYVSLRKIFQDYYPDYYQEWKKFCKQDKESLSWLPEFSPCNMFYTDARSFNEYCGWLFGFLFRLRRMLGDIDGTPYEKRYCAFIGERLLTSYLEHNHKKYKTLYGVGASTPFYAFLSRLAHGLKLNIDAKYYDLIRGFLRKYTHYRPAVSSWSRT